MAGGEATENGRRGGGGLDVWVRLVRDLGFPAVVAFYLLWRLDGQVSSIVRELSETRDAMRAVVRMHEEDHWWRFKRDAERGGTADKGGH